MKYLNKNRFWKIDKDYNIDKILYLLIDRYDIITNVCFIWYNDKGEYHRNYDLPAFVWRDHSEIIWFKNNEEIKTKNNISPKNLYKK